MSEKKFNPNDHMIDLRGRSYLPVAARVAWFRDCHPGGCVDTDILMVGDMYLARARVIVDGAIVATGHATLRDGKGQTWAGREIEKAETAAIGRALAVAGYGTLAAADELDDTDYLSDAPVDRAARIDAAKKNLGPLPRARQRPNAADSRPLSAPAPAPAPDNASTEIPYTAVPRWENLVVSHFRGAAYRNHKHVTNTVAKLTADGTLKGGETLRELLDVLAARKDVPDEAA